MKRLLIFLLIAALCLSMAGCSVGLPDIFRPKADRDSLLLGHSLQMARITGAIAENYDMISGPASLMELAGGFACLADEMPDKAWIADVGDITTKVSIMNGQLLGNEHLACAGSLTHGTLVQMPEELDDRYGVLLRFPDKKEDAYCLVVYEPVDGAVTSVMACPVYPEIAEDLIDRYFDDAEPYDENEIEKRCEAAEKVSFTARAAKEDPTAGFYEEKALQVMQGVADGRGNPERYTTMEEILAYCDLWEEVAGDTPTDVEVWVLEDLDERIEDYAGEKISDDHLQAYFRRMIGPTYIQSISAAYGSTVIAANAVINRMSESVCLGPAPEQQQGLILVALRFDEDATALVCIYDSGYGLNQYAFGFIPGEWEGDPEDDGFEALD